MIAVLAVLTGCIKEKQTAADLKVGETLPDFEVVMNDGNVVSDDILKKSVSVVMFFHTSCPDCRQVLPEMQKIYDEYAHSIYQHMVYEEKTVFPYVESLINGNPKPNFSIETYSKRHEQTDMKLRELKNIIIKYLPSDSHRNNLLMAALHDIFNNEEWLAQHADVEDYIFIPAIEHLERKMRQKDVSMKISGMISNTKSHSEALSERERDVVVALVQGMSNKEIADHLCIATNTVITHRRNIAKKLQIHSPAGLTIYAIVNNLVDISNIKL